MNDSHASNSPGDESTAAETRTGKLGARAIRVDPTSRPLPAAASAIQLPAIALTQRNVQAAATGSIGIGAKRADIVRLDGAIQEVLGRLRGVLNSDQASQCLQAMLKLREQAEPLTGTGAAYTALLDLRLRRQLQKLSLVELGRLVGSWSAPAMKEAVAHQPAAAASDCGILSTTLRRSFLARMQMQLGPTLEPLLERVLQSLPRADSPTEPTPGNRRFDELFDLAVSTAESLALMLRNAGYVGPALEDRKATACGLLRQVAAGLSPDDRRTLVQHLPLAALKQLHHAQLPAGLLSPEKPSRPNEAESEPSRSGGFEGIGKEINDEIRSRRERDLERAERLVDTLRTCSGQDLSGLIRDLCELAGSLDQFRDDESSAPGNWLQGLEAKLAQPLGSALKLLMVARPDGQSPLRQLSTDDLHHLQSALGSFNRGEFVQTGLADQITGAIRVELEARRQVKVLSITQTLRSFLKGAHTADPVRTLTALKELARDLDEFVHLSTAAEGGTAAVVSASRTRKEVLKQALAARNATADQLKSVLQQLEASELSVVRDAMQEAAADLAIRNPEQQAEVYQGLLTISEVTDLLEETMLTLNPLAPPLLERPARPGASKRLGDTAKSALRDIYGIQSSADVETPRP